MVLLLSVVAVLAVVHTILSPNGYIVMCGRTLDGLCLMYSLVIALCEDLTCGIMQGVESDYKEGSAGGEMSLKSRKESIRIGNEFNLPFVKGKGYPAADEIQRLRARVAECEDEVFRLQVVIATARDWLEGDGIGLCDDHQTTTVLLSILSGDKREVTE